MRPLVLLAFACGLPPAHATDMRTVPPMHSEKIAADVELKGRELESVEVALRQFRIAKFSTSGDLKHFTIELRREPGKLFVSFYPDTMRRVVMRCQHGTITALTSRMPCRYAH